MFLKHRHRRPTGGPAYGHGRHRQRGQSLLEFALVFPIFVLFLGAIVQFGIILWGQNTLNQVVRDTGRYAATLNCSAGAVTAAQGQFTTLLASAGGPWRNGSSTVTYSSPTCPADNRTAVFVHVVGLADAPIFFPWVPGNGHLTSITDYRVEPAP